MSELQIALLLIAGVVLAALYLAGKWQERRLLRRLGEELGGGVGDALLGGTGTAPSRAPASGYGRAPAAPRRIEPLLPAEPAAPAASPSPTVRRSEWVEDPLLDCVVELRCARPVDGVSFIDAAIPLTGSQWAMPVWFVVWDARAQQWVHPDRFGYYSEALAAIQLANRRNVLDEVEIGRFVSCVRQVAGVLDADCDPPDLTRVAANAIDLDRLCARFDVRIGLTLESSSGPWSEARVTAAAAQCGLHPLAELQWIPPREPGGAPLMLAMPGQASDRIVLELDVPSAESGSAAVQQLFSLANQLGTLLKARIVDDNGQPIDAQSVLAIEGQLDQLYGDMRAAGVDPGGERARRLYV